jgi:hypothetical protein
MVFLLVENYPVSVELVPLPMLVLQPKPVPLQEPVPQPQQAVPLLPHHGLLVLQVCTQLVDYACLYIYYDSVCHFLSFIHDVD